MVQPNDVNKIEFLRQYTLQVFFYLGISMRGNKDDVLRCLTEVYGVLDGVPVRGSYRYYDPSTYDGYNVADYGGYSDNFMRNNQPNFRTQNNNVPGYAHNSYAIKTNFFAHQILFSTL